MESIWRTKRQAAIGVFLPLMAICVVAGMTQDIMGRIILAGLALLFIGFKILLKRADARQMRESQAKKNGAIQGDPHGTQ